MRRANISAEDLRIRVCEKFREGANGKSTQLFGVFSRDLGIISKYVQGFRPEIIGFGQIIKKALQMYSL